MVIFDISMLFFIRQLSFLVFFRDNCHSLRSERNGQIFFACCRGNILRITSVHKEDRGTYYCVAENGVGKGARRNINLEVEFAPVVTVPRPRLSQVKVFYRTKK